MYKSILKLIPYSAILSYIAEVDAEAERVLKDAEATKARYIKETTVITREFGKKGIDLWGSKRWHNLCMEQLI